MPTADESNHSAAGTLHPVHTAVPHSSYTLGLHCADRFPLKEEICPFLFGLHTPPEKNHPLTHAIHHPKRHNWRIHWTYCY